MAQRKINETKNKPTTKPESSSIASRQPQPKCPQCGSKRLYKDGLRYLKDGGTVQRWLCRNCGYRFSDPNQKKNCNPSDMSQHVQKIQRLNLKMPDPLTYSCQVSARRQGGAKNLVEMESRSERRVAGATVRHNEADLKGKIIEYMWYMKKQGYAETTIQTYVIIIKMLKKRGADLYDPENVKKIIAQQQSWSKGRKWNVVKAYTLFLKTQGLTWEKPRYKPVQKLPFIPTEKEIDELIAGCSKQMATFLEVLKETGARRGEAFNLKWTDIDLVSGTIRITPEKGSNPRLFKTSTKLARMLGSLPRTSDRVWIYKNVYNLGKGFCRQRKRVTHKLGNPRILRIHFHTLRHWKATTEYAKTKDILYVQKLLGHRNLKNTLRYTQLVALPQNEEYICKAAKTVEGAKELIEAGFEYVTDINDCKLFRKMKTSYLGT